MLTLDNVILFIYAMPRTCVIITACLSDAVRHADDNTLHRTSPTTVVTVAACRHADVTPPAYACCHYPLTLLRFRFSDAYHGAFSQRHFYARIYKSAGGDGSP